MEVSFDVVVTSLLFGVPFGYYNLRLGWSCLVIIQSSTELDMRTIDKILPPTDGCQMIVYNGTNHFKYFRYIPPTVISISSTFTKKCAPLQDEVESMTKDDMIKFLTDLDSIVPI